MVSPAPETAAKVRTLGLSSGATVFAIFVILVGGCSSLGSGSAALRGAQFVASGDISALEEVGNRSVPAALLKDLETGLRPIVAFHVAVSIPFALLTAAMALLAAFVLGGSARARYWIARVALLTCVMRIPVGIADYLLISEVVSVVARGALDTSAQLKPDATLHERAKAARSAGRNQENVKKVEGMATGVMSLAGFLRALAAIVFWVMAGGILGRAPTAESKDGLAADPATP